VFAVATGTSPATVRVIASTLDLRRRSRRRAGGQGRRNSGNQCRSGRVKESPSSLCANCRNECRHHYEMRDYFSAGAWHEIRSDTARVNENYPSPRPPVCRPHQEQITGSAQSSGKDPAGSSRCINDRPSSPRTRRPVPRSTGFRRNEEIFEKIDADKKRNSKLEVAPLESGDGRRTSALPPVPVISLHSSAAAPCSVTTPVRQSARGS